MRFFTILVCCVIAAITCLVAAIWYARPILHVEVKVTPTVAVVSEPLDKSSPLQGAVGADASIKSPPLGTALPLQAWLPNMPPMGPSMPSPDQFQAPSEEIIGLPIGPRIALGPIPPEEVAEEGPTTGSPATSPPFIPGIGPLPPAVYSPANNAYVSPW